MNSSSTDSDMTGCARVLVVRSSENEELQLPRSYMEGVGLLMLPLRMRGLI
uniref:Uncharacterized protein n=1 Tax=Lepeophtheirus salmonis TaxID=72036 RepID=A0A0K2TNH0_LEPSM